MKKYILHGGNAFIDSELNKDFFETIVEELNEGDNLLLCFFAPTARTEGQSFTMLSKAIKENNFDNKDINLTFSKRQIFMEQLKEADAVYIHGGDTDELMEILKDFPGFVEELSKKELLIGSSAGANILSKYSLSFIDGGDVKERLGILPIKITAHFEDKNRKIVLSKFSKVDPKNEFESISLKESEMKIIEK